MEILTDAIIREMIKNDEAVKSGDAKGIVFYDMPNDIYHASAGISSSNIKTFINRTVAAYLWEKENPKKDTTAFRLGRGIHTSVLEPRKFLDLYLTERPEIPARRGATKSVYEQWASENEDVLIKGYGGKLSSEQWANEYIKWKNPTKEWLSSTEADMVAGVTKSINNHPKISKLLKNSICEASYFWIDEETNIVCKCRPDLLKRDGGISIVGDVKSCQNAGLDEFEGDITTHDYHISAAWYLDGLNYIGLALDQFVYIPCEKTAPFAATLYPATEASLDIGKGLCRAGLAIYARYLELEKEGLEWAGHSKKIKGAGVRPWAFNKLSQVIAKHDLHDMDLEKYLVV